MVSHFNLEEYPNQKLFIVSIKDYTYYVPFVEDDEKVFLKIREKLQSEDVDALLTFLDTQE